MLPPLLVVVGFFTSHLIPGGSSQDWDVRGVSLPPPTRGDGDAKPYIRNTANAPREFFEGDDMLLTCVVSNLGNHSVAWINNAKKSLLAVGDSPIIPDERVSILHDKAPSYNSSIIRPGGDVWVLVIKNVKKTDSGEYVCTVNSNPPLDSRYMVTVNPRDNTTQLTKALRSNHNYTDCCQQNGVIPACWGFCAIHNILEGTTGIEPEACEKHFPNIVQCMADFRNHIPCCERERVPDICQDLCRGDYTMQEDNIQSHFSCTSYTEVTLMCISEGIELLPVSPDSPTVTVLGPTSIQVDWSHPPPNSPPADFYVVNVTTIKTFDPPMDVSLIEADEGGVGSLDSDDNKQFTLRRRTIKVPSTQKRTIVRNLAPLTWVEVSVTSMNRHGSSLPHYSVRALTQATAVNKTDVIHPTLPDVVGCCTDRGVKHYRCLRNLCDPSQRYISEPDMIVCAPWATEAFSCLANDYDHSECCQARGMPPLCVELCTGNVTKIDYKYFRCVEYFNDYRSCLMKGYNVLPGNPKTISVSNIHPTFALISWVRPDLLGDSVTSYHTLSRPLTEPTCDSLWISDVTYSIGFSEQPPYVLENLCPGTEYEVYVQALNKHGTGDPSERVIFRTPTIVHEQRLENTTYNISACCTQVNVSPGCMPLCDYRARMSHVRKLATTCTPELSKMLRCAVGGRDHRPCCKRRGVPAACMSVCSGAFVADRATPTVCMPYIGNIMMCLEEGVGVLPGPVTILHATKVTDNSVTLVWQEPQEGPNATMYQLHYQSVDKHSASHVVFALNNTQNLTDTVAEVKDLKKGSLYNFFVVAINEEGMSLPSSVITVNVTSESANGTSIAGVSSPPHSVVLEAKTATTLTIGWQPPILALPTDRFKYKIHYQAVTSDETPGKYNEHIIGPTALRLENLTPNTQYVIFVTAINDMGESRPSETLLAWTDPAYPAFVEKPTIHPINLIVEGGNMTVLCIAMGSPPPTVSLYISGLLVNQNVTRHMVTVVPNVTRNMTDISCYADNGYGTPMQASKTIRISRRPIIASDPVVRVTQEDSVTIECKVDAWPEPSLVWWRDPEGRVPVIHGGNYVIHHPAEIVSGRGIYSMKLSIKTVGENETGLYYCFARNAFGTFTRVTKITLKTPIKLEMDVTECCRVNNVSDACADACSFDELNFERVMNREECIPEFSKLMKCAADGSDHRSCCSQKGVPVHCLDWCRGEPVPRQNLCVLQWAPPIFTCFNEGKGMLPGPPQNLSIISDSSSSAHVAWKAPVKNPQAVELYRVFWRPFGNRTAMKNDTSETSMTIKGLQEGMTYEIAVKAGNSQGTSVLTPTVNFTHSSNYVTSSNLQGSSGVGVAIGGVVVVLLTTTVVVAVFFARKKHLFGGKGSANGGISFENPSYIREQNGDTVQIAETPNGSLNGNITTGMNGRVNGSISDGMHGIIGGSDIGENGISPMNINNGMWNLQTASNTTPGFQDDLPSNGGYKRFSS
ncbi:Ig-like and fibronectin type-III domain-containing protein 1 isoform X2 [Macrobrachium nipponense]|uniref:Ig-like and fibronectin type-III domain-containing protein 1 isoform X2 n=1 Tax=Macrobrachium nipponense TaxID=159736 RepID=UPI0030C8A64F